MNTSLLSVLGLASVLVFGCAQELPQTQSPANPTTSLAASPSAESTMAGEKSMTTTAVKSGSFVSGEHPTQGTVKILTQANKRILELDENFKTFDMGPDLVVALHRSADVIGSTKPPAYALKEGDYVVLAPLKKFSGAQAYEVPKNIDLANYKSVVIWCRKFNATFGAAKLSL
jgi:hypothetical protein